MIGKTVIWLIKIYQKYISPKIKNRCRYVPSCSQYMILAIEKYGTRKGIKMGINRIMRCHYPNGGIDYP